MATYLVGDVRVREPDKYKEYLVEVPKIAAKHGGKYLVRGGELTLNEGDWAPTRMVIIEFPTRKDAMNFYEGDEYAPWKKIRNMYADSDLVFVDGV
ncbi:MAG: DUF1330 domain-containing protein [Dehalococcoidia bacterium]|jgi:uncharacterized protein (DUF1330 family)|nr:DUF1330 domain-containing protein [Dehalococcoidia bacterium]|tara:strand:+ start:2626 stop:2913 length:288 start_codon:yes stop_codon:yes gene_type:complete